MNLLQVFFDQVRQARLTIQPKKSKVGFLKITFLGLKLAGEVLQPLTELSRKFKERNFQNEGRGPLLSRSNRLLRVVYF